MEKIDGSIGILCVCYIVFERRVRMKAREGKNVFLFHGEPVPYSFRLPVPHLTQRPHPSTSDSEAEDEKLQISKLYQKFVCFSNLIRIIGLPRATNYFRRALKQTKKWLEEGRCLFDDTKIGHIFLKGKSSN